MDIEKSYSNRIQWLLKDRSKARSKTLRESITAAIAYTHLCKLMLGDLNEGLRRFKAFQEKRNLSESQFWKKQLDSGDQNRRLLISIAAENNNSETKEMIERELAHNLANTEETKESIDLVDAMNEMNDQLVTNRAPKLVNNLDELFRSNNDAEYLAAWFLNLLPFTIQLIAGLISLPAGIGVAVAEKMRGDFTYQIKRFQGADKYLSFIDTYNFIAFNWCVSAESMIKYINKLENTLIPVSIEKLSKDISPVDEKKIADDLNNLYEKVEARHQEILKGLTKQNKK